MSTPQESFIVTSLCVDQGVLTGAEALDAARRILYQNNREVCRLEAA